MMLLMKGKTVNAQYPNGIIAMLVQQYSVLPLYRACQTLQACFCNTHGRPDTHVPVDIVNEWAVRTQKKHFRHNGPNKSEQQIFKQSAALPGVADIAENYSAEVDTVHRSNRHQRKIDDDAFDKMVVDFRQVQPFDHVEDRHFAAFPHMFSSLTERVDGHWIRHWISNRLDTLIP